MSDAPSPAASTEYDFSGLPSASVRAREGVTSPLTRMLVFIGMALVGLALAGAGAVVTGVAEHEAATAEAEAAAAAVLDAAQELDSATFLVIELGRLLEFLGAGLVVGGVTLAVWHAVRGESGRPRE